MSTYRVYGTTQNAGVATSSLVIAYKGSRDAQHLPVLGDELGRATSAANGSFQIYYSDWPHDIFLVAMDLTDSPQRYNATVLDWTKGVYVDNDVDFQNVVSLLHMDGANAGTSFPDVIGANTWVPYGTPTTSTAQSKFGGTSLSVNGVSGLRCTPPPSGLVFSSSDFCIEGWVYLTANPAYQVFFDSRAATGYGPVLIRIDSGGIPKLWVSASGSGWILGAYASSSSMSQNTWHHLAVCKISGVYKFYINGVAAGSTTNTTALMTTPSEHVSVGIGSYENNGVIGFIEDFRITIGSGRYPTAFVPINAPFPNETGDAHYPYVRSLIHCDGANGGSVFTDEVGNVITTTGTPTTNTADKMSGTASLQLNGTSKLLLTYNPDMYIGNKDFTFEAWVKPTLTGSNIYRYIVDTQPSHAGYRAFVISIYNGLWQVHVRNGVSAWANTLTIPVGTLSVWKHVALTRSLGFVRFFVDGVKIWEAAQTYTIIDDNLPISIGDIWTGFIDDIRYTVGAARYTENFTPQTTQFPSS